MANIIDPFDKIKIIDPFDSAIKTSNDQEKSIAPTKSDAELFQEAVAYGRTKPFEYGDSFMGNILPAVGNTINAVRDIPSSVSLGAMRGILGLGQLGERGFSLAKDALGGDKVLDKNLSDIVTGNEMPKQFSPSEYALNIVNDAQNKLEERAGSGAQYIPKAGAFFGEAFGNPVNRLLAARGVIGGGLSAGAMGLSAPTDTGLTDKQYLNQKAFDVPASALLGGVLGGVLREPSKEIAKLAEAGVDKLPIGFLGSGYGVLDNIAKIFPFVKGAVEKSEQVAINDLNRAVANKALEPLGMTVPKSLSPGHATNTYVQKEIGKAYDNITPQISLDFSPAIENSLRNKAALLTTDMTPESATKFYQAFDKLFENVGKVNVTPGTGHVSRIIPGNTYREIESRLGKMATEYMNGNATAGSGLFKLQDTLRKELRDQNPSLADDLQSIHNAYRNSRVLDKVDKNTGAVDVAGTMTPGQLASLTNRKRMGGVDNELRDLAEAAKSVMGSKGSTGNLDLGSLGHVAVPGGIGAGASIAQNSAITPEMGAGALAILFGGSLAGQAINNPLFIKGANLMRQSAPEPFITATPQMASPLSGGNFIQGLTGYKPNQKED